MLDHSVSAILPLGNSRPIADPIARMKNHQLAFVDTREHLGATFVEAPEANLAALRAPAAAEPTPPTARQCVT
ncbi:MAG TPA: hypothetical protein QF813_07080 [Alphaproteobacteria bacterium]|jgi:hypothetical protein|nr:hypothetical protein [Alphaproteobacteria bacterium]|tara:strand:+ start:858 stop:1076 length:219 start_codon:yes stop_codon:yes gene_type:complete